MYILDIKNQNLNTTKTLIIYSLLSVLCFSINKVYGLFGHGVSSNSMSLMFLYPLAGGLIYFIIVRTLFPKISNFSGFRVFYNLHNSGIAFLTMGSLAKGIFEIAGTSSQYTIIFFIAGWLFIFIGFILLILLAANQKKADVSL